MLSKEVLSFEGDDVCALNGELLFVVRCCCCVCSRVMGVAVRAAQGSGSDDGISNLECNGNGASSMK